MKRDMELVRQILLAVEAHPSAVQPCELHIPGFSEEQIAYHTQLLSQAGFLEGVKYDGPWGAEVVPVRLTWAGHEFLEAAREPMRWTQAKALIGKIGGASLCVWKKLLAHLALKTLGL